MNQIETKEVTVKEAKEVYKNSKGKLVDEVSNAFVSLRNINKVYPNGVQAVYDFNLDINKHEFVALVGPSGCGKSTTLRMVAGLEEISSGYLYINNVLSNYLPSKDRDIAMVFQSYALYPQMTVYENIAFGLEIRKIDKKEIQNRVFQAAKILNLGPYLDRRPKELSGGQMQRVALGRAIVRNAQLFLMDEPLSNLDAKLRVQMRSEIIRIHEEVGATTIYVTHDQIEAMTMADKIVVMNKGFVQQIGRPMDIYENPENLFVATFIGSPAMNIIDAIYDKETIKFNDGFEIKLGSNYQKVHDDFYKSKIHELEVILAKFDELGKEEIEKIKSAQVFSKNEVDSDSQINYQMKVSKIQKFIAKFAKKEKEPVLDEKEEFKAQLQGHLQDYKDALTKPHSIKIGIRPEDIFLHSKEVNSPSKEFIVKANIVEILGSEFIVHFNFNEALVSAKLDTSTYIKAHSDIKLVMDTSKIHLFDTISGQRIKK